MESMNWEVFPQIDSNLIKHIQESILSTYLEEQEMILLAQVGKLVSFPPEHIILKQGFRTQTLIIVLEGNVLMGAQILGQGVINIENYGPGSFLGEICFIEKGPCPMSAVAKTKVIGLALSSTIFDLIGNYYPSLKFKILKAIANQVCNRLKHMHDKVTHYITDSPMISLSILSKVINSLNQARIITFTEAGIQPQQLIEKPLFQGFEQDELEEILSRAVFLEAPKHAILIDEREKKSSCFIVLQGAVQSSIIKNYKLAKLSVIGPGTLFAGVACLNKNLNFTVSFSACEQAILLKLNEPDLEYFQNKRPMLWYKLFNLICISLVALEKSIDKLDIRLHIETYNR